MPWTRTSTWTPDGSPPASTCPASTATRSACGFAGDALVIEAHRTGQEPGQRTKVLAAERSTGAVRRIFRTGLNLDADSVSARFDDGVLTVQAGTRTPGRTVQVAFGEGSSQQSLTATGEQQPAQEG